MLRSRGGGEVSRVACLPKVRSVKSRVVSRIVRTVRTCSCDGCATTSIGGTLARSRHAPRSFHTLLSPTTLPFLRRVTRTTRGRAEGRFKGDICVFAPVCVTGCYRGCYVCYKFGYRGGVGHTRLGTRRVRGRVTTVTRAKLRRVLVLAKRDHGGSAMRCVKRTYGVTEGCFGIVNLRVCPIGSSRCTCLRRYKTSCMAMFRRACGSSGCRALRLTKRGEVFPCHIGTRRETIGNNVQKIKFNTLLKLSSFEGSTFTANCRTCLLREGCPRTRVTFSYPELHPVVGGSEVGPVSIRRPRLLRIIYTCHLFVPFTDVAISAERYTHIESGLIDVTTAGVSTKIDAKVKDRISSVRSGKSSRFRVSSRHSMSRICSTLLGGGLRPIVDSCVCIWSGVQFVESELRDSDYRWRGAL